VRNSGEESFAFSSRYPFTALPLIFSHPELASTRRVRCPSADAPETISSDAGCLLTVCWELSCCSEKQTESERLTQQCLVRACVCGVHRANHPSFAVQPTHFHAVVNIQHHQLVARKLSRTQTVDFTSTGSCLGSLESRVTSSPGRKPPRTLSCLTIPILPTSLSLRPASVWVVHCMESYENMQSSFSAKRAPPKSLDLQSSSAARGGAARDGSPPRTPIRKSPRTAKGNNGGASQALRLRSSSPPPPRATFLDDITPVDNIRNGQQRAGDEPGGVRRDSHDLSLSPREGNRESLVDNLLLSFNQLSTLVPETSPADEEHIYTPFGDNLPSPSSPLRTTFTKNDRQRDFTSSSSYSPEIDRGDDSSNRYSRRQGNNRRSNNSSISNSNNNQGSIGRIESLRQDVGRGKFFDAQRKTPSPTHGRYGYSREGQGSNNAGSTDLGYDQVARGGRWTNDTHSSGLDKPYGERMVHSSGSNMAPINNFADGERSQAVEYHGYDAAPTPTVPVGPRKLPPQSPPPQGAYPPQPSHPPPQTPKLERKKSTKSPKSLYNRAGRSNTLGASSVRSPTDSFGDVSDPRELPPLPAFVNPPAPSPSIPFEKPTYPPPQPPQPPTKERQGFFKRVFRSSSKNSTPLNQAPSPSPLGQPEHLPPRGKEYQHIVEQMIRPWSPKLQVDPSQQRPTTPIESTPQQTPPHPLNKKHSFFRRRKKSVSEHNSVPVPPLQVQQIQHPQLQQAQQAQNADAASSPVSSLRQVMSPYLRSPGGHPEEYQPYWRDQYGVDSDDNQSSDTAGPPHNHRSLNNPTVRVVPRSREGTEFVQSQGRSIASAGQDSAYPNSHARALVSNARNHVRDATENSFLQDSSGNEDRNPKEVSVHHRRSNLVYQDEERRPRTSPTSPTYRDVVVRSEMEKEERRLPVVKNTETLAPEPAVLDGPRNSPESINSAAIKGERMTMATETETLEGAVGKRELAKSDEFPPSRGPSENLDKSWLGPASPEEEPNAPSSLPLAGPRDSQRVSGSTNNSDYKSASSVPVVQIDGQHTSAVPSINTEAISEDECQPTAEDRALAKKVFDGDEEIISKARAVSWLGDSGAVGYRARKAYMELYDWTNMNVLAAMRVLCGRLVLRGETQQIDRILNAFSRRWCECNPNHGFKHTGNSPFEADTDLMANNIHIYVDVVHTICYSLLLLNTDLHLADIEQKMTRSQFIKNTIPTIVRVASEQAPETFIQKRSSFLPSKPQVPHSDQGIRSPVATTLQRYSPERREEKTSLDIDAGSRTYTERTAALALLSTQDDEPPPTPQHFDANDCDPLVNEQFHGTGRQWESQLEVILKEFFNSIRQQRLPLHGSMPDPTQDQQGSSNNLSVFAQGQALLRRSPSVLSKAPSENFTQSSRSRQEAYRPSTGRWSSKNRSRPRLYPGSAVGSSRTSLDDQSIWSPSVSSTWSKYSLNKTQTSMSVESFSSNFPQGDYQQSIGFANALSQAIIREETPGGLTAASAAADDGAALLLDSDSLELAGAPWAKEGILKHKHHLESVDKKAKNRNWTECFAVIERGMMRLFSFSTKTATRNRQPNAGVVGGGNWTENAEALGSFLLRQTIASALPPPGYSKARPHVWALSLPTGAVHLFQVGTPEIVKEFVSTANYWSARLSKEPLIGGICNIEYGWSDMVVNVTLTQTEPQTPTKYNHSRTRSTSGPHSRPSLQSSIRSSMEQGSMKPRLPGDRVNISDWTPPQQSMMASHLHEKDQLQVCVVSTINRL
jgi:Sec7 domain/Pleckstrin homology domain